MLQLAQWLNTLLLLELACSDLILQELISAGLNPFSKLNLLHEKTAALITAAPYEVM